MNFKYLLEDQYAKIILHGNYNKSKTTLLSMHKQNIQLINVPVSTGKF